MGGSQQPTTTTQIQKVELPAWVDNASQQNYQFAQQVADRPYQSYQGQQVADNSAATIWANNNLNNTADRTNSALAAAQAAFGNLPTNYQPQMVSMPGGVANVPTFARAGDVTGGLGYREIAQPQAVRDVTESKGVAPIAAATGVADVSARTLPQTDLSGYLSPYTQNVVDTTLSGMRDNLAISGQKADDAARGSGAWGSSRSGVQQAVLASQGAKDMAATEAGLRDTAYTRATTLAQNDNASALQAALANQNSALNTQQQNTVRSQSNQQAGLATEALNAGIRQGNQNSALTTAAQRLAADTSNSANYLANAGQKLTADMANQSSFNTNNALNAGILQGNQQAGLTTNAQRLQAQIANQGAGLSAANLNASTAISGAQGLLGTGQAYSQTGTAQSALASALGQQEEARQQANLNAAKAAWEGAYNAPVDALNTRLAALGMSPYGKTTTSVGQQSGGTSSNTGMGILGGALSILPMLFSDPKTKKNIRKLGPTGAPGLNAYEYEYKDKMGGPKGQKHIGVMADEVKKVVPSALARAKAADGKVYDAVDYQKVGQHIAKKRGFLAKKAA
jgi:hypothetical protein